MADINHDGYYDIPIVYDQKIIKLGYSDTKIDFDIGKEIDKSMIKIFGFDVKTDYDYYLYKKQKKNYTVVDFNKPGLATIFKETISTIGDMLGFLFKLIKQSIDQIVTSFIMPILTPATPYTLPLIIKNIIKIVTNIVEMIKEAITVVTETSKWLLEKVGGKILDINIPIPEFKIPIFGLGVAIPMIDKLKLIKTEPFASLPSDKIKNINTQIGNVNKKIGSLPLNNIDDISKLKDKKKQLDIQNSKLSKTEDSEVKSLTEQLNAIQYDISMLRESKSQNNLNFLNNTLKSMEACLETLKRALFETTFETVKLIIEVHNEVIMKKKEYLDEYLKLFITDKKNINLITTVTGVKLTTINEQLALKGFSLYNVGKHIETHVVKDNKTDVNGDINYVVSVESLPIKGTSDFVGYISYKFTNRLSIYQSDFDILNNNKEVIREYKNNGRTIKNYKFTGDFNYLKKVVGRLVDELEKEELDLEEDINIYKVESVPSINNKILVLNDLLNKSYVKKLKSDEYYRIPKLSDDEITNLKKLGQTIPAQDVEVKEITIDGYADRIISNKNNIDEIVKSINDLEKNISDFKKRIDTYNSNVDSKDVINDKIKKLEEEKNKIKTELVQKSPESIVQSTIIELLKSVITFPIQLIVGLLGDLMGGIVDFITSLPLLNFDKIMTFFQSLIQLPNVDGMSKSMGEVIADVTGAPPEFMTPISNVISIVPESTTNVASEFIEQKFLKEVPFKLPPVEPKIPTLPISDTQTTDNTVNVKEKQFDNKQNNKTYKQYKNSNTSQFGLISKLHPLVRNEFYGIYEKLNSGLSQFGVSFRITLTYRSSEYQQDLINVFYNNKKESKRRGIVHAPAPVGRSFHEFGLAFDASIIKLNKDGDKEKGIKYAVEFLSKYGWNRPVKDDYVHWEKHTINGSTYSTASNFPKGKIYENDMVYPKLT